MTDLNDTVHPAPRLLNAGARLLAAGFVGLSLATVVAVSTSASRVAVRTMTAQLQETPRVVTLPPVLVVVRRVTAMGASAGAQAMSGPAPAPGCIQPS